MEVSTSSSSKTDVENPTRRTTSTAPSDNSNLKRTGATAEDHTTRDSTAVAQLSQDTSKFYGLEAHYTSPESLCECTFRWSWLCIGLDQAQKLPPCFGEMRAQVGQDEVTMPGLWKVVLSSEDYDLVRWLKTTGFPPHEGGSYQPEDTPDKDRIERKLPKSTSKTLNLVTKVKVILLWVFGLTGVVAWIVFSTHKTYVLLRALFTFTVPVPATCIVVSAGKGLVLVIVPAVQLLSTAWTVRKVTSELKGNSSTLRYHASLLVPGEDKHYEPCKKDSFNFFYTLMTALVVSLSWLSVRYTRTGKKGVDIFLLVSSYYLLELNVVQYLALSVFLVSVGCKEVQKKQFDLLNLLLEEDSYKLDSEDDIFSSFYKSFGRVLYFIPFGSEKHLKSTEEVTKYLSEVRVTLSSFLDFELETKCPCLEKTKCPCLEKTQCLWPEKAQLKRCTVSVYGTRYFGLLLGSFFLVTAAVVYYSIWTTLTVLIVTCILVVAGTGLCIGAVFLSLRLVAEVFRALACCCLKVERKTVHHYSDFSKVTFVQHKDASQVVEVKEFKGGTERAHSEGNYKLYHSDGLKSSVYELEKVYRLRDYTVGKSTKGTKWESVQEDYGDLYSKYSEVYRRENSRSTEDDFPVMKPKLTTRLDLETYQKYSEETVSTIERRKTSTDLVLLASLLNTVGLLLLIWLDVPASSDTSTTKIKRPVPLTPVLVKEVVVFLYILQKGTLISSALDDFTKTLLSKVLELSRTSPTEVLRVSPTTKMSETSSDVLRELELVLAHSTRVPTSFTFLGYRVSRENWLVFAYSLLFALTTSVTYFYSRIQSELLVDDDDDDTDYHYGYGDFEMSPTLSPTLSPTHEKIKEFNSFFCSF